MVGIGKSPWGLEKLYELMCRQSLKCDMRRGGGFRKGRGCVVQVLILKHSFERKKDLWVTYMNVEKAYDRVKREES